MKHGDAIVAALFTVAIIAFAALYIIDQQTSP